jgi:hypothetical protein
MPSVRQRVGLAERMPVLSEQIGLSLEERSVASGDAQSLPLLQHFNSSPEVIRLVVTMSVRVAQLPGPGLAHDSLGNIHCDLCCL